MKRFTVVVGVDFSELSREAVRVATNVARASGDAELHLVHVLAPPIMTGDVPVTFHVKNIRAPVRARTPPPVPRTSSIAWSSRETFGSSGGGANFAMTSAETDSAPRPE